MGPIDPHTGILMLLATAFLGSWHCAGMCGPIALLMGRGLSLVWYQLGRGTAYASLGLFAGFAGDQILYRMQHWQNSGLRFFVIAVTAIIMALSAWLWIRKLPSQMPRWVRGVPQALRPWAMGFSTAAFPCGWLWSFLAAAAVTGSAVAGSLVMLALWLGGIPALSFFAELKRPFEVAMPRKFRPYLVGLLWVASIWGLISQWIMQSL